MQIFHRLRLLICFFGRVVSTLTALALPILQLSISHAVESVSSPSKAYCLHSLTIGVTSGSAKPAHAFLQYAFGGDAGHCPRVQRIVQQSSTNSLFIWDYYISKHILGEAKDNLFYSQ